jgi:hypothetical protein
VQSPEFRPQSHQKKKKKNSRQSRVAFTPVILTAQEIRRIMVRSLEASPGKEFMKILWWKKKKKKKNSHKRTGGVAQVVEHLLSVRKNTTCKKCS